MIMSCAYREMNAPKTPRTKQKILRFEIMLSFLFLIFLEICCVASFHDHFWYCYVLFYHICWGVLYFCDISCVSQVCFWWSLHCNLVKIHSIFVPFYCCLNFKAVLNNDMLFCCCSHGFLLPTNQQGAILQLSTMIRWYQMRVRLLISQWARECLQGFLSLSSKKSSLILVLQPSLLTFSFYLIDICAH